VFKSIESSQEKISLLEEKFAKRKFKKDVDKIRRGDKSIDLFY